MGLSGMLTGPYLDHANGCEGREFSKCGVVARRKYADPGDPTEEIVVVRMDWCGTCGAAEWEYV